MSCLTCGKDTSNPKFCSRSCAAKTNNHICKRREKEGNCKTCHSQISTKYVYCSECYKKYLDNIKNYTPCPSCGKDRTPENTRKYKKRLQGYCKECTAKNLNKRSRTLKEKCVQYKGGCCQTCGYNKCNAALDFHHINPDEKDFNISAALGRKFDDEIKNELDKCIILCANCHREEHFRLLYGEYK